MSVPFLSCSNYYLIAWFHFSSDDRIKDLEAYILILHSEDDQTIPCHLARNLFRFKEYSIQPN